MADGPGKNKEGEEEVPYTDETVTEFLKQRQERILVRRARIGEKLAKKNEALREGSIASSLEFLTTAEDDQKSRPSTSGDKNSTSGKKGGGGPQSQGGEEKQKLNEADLKRSATDSLDTQIDESRKQLEQIILDGEALITNVRVAAECREKNRHTKFMENKRDRCERLKKEAAECQQMYEDLKPNFDMTAEKKLPMDLFEAIKNQMQNCEEILMKKQDLIQELQQEVEDADFEFEQTLEMYQKDVSLMGDRIDDSMDELMGAFLNELNLIEDYTCRNREVMLEENHRQWMDLLGEFEEMEAQALEERKKDALNKFQLLNDLYITTKQECRAQRHKFEDDFRILIQELEQVKYATQLNMEKLQYNLAILRKRYKENVEMKNMMKRLLLKFNDRFTEKSRALKRKMEAGKKEAKKILSDIAKLEESLDQFGKKTLHLAVTDWHKYMDLWSVSEEMVRERLAKLLDSEKFVFETQLGVDAPMPSLDFMDERPDVVTKHFMKKSATYAELTGKNKQQPADSAAPEEKDKKKSVMSVTEDYTDNSAGEGKIDPCKTASLLLFPSESIEFIPGPGPDPAIQRRVMKHLAKKICNESGFLVEEELRKLLEPFIETERNLVNLDALLKALGINSVTEMQYLAHFLLRRCRVMKGVISRIGSQESAHLSEMNVSLEGILGKNNWEDWESGTGTSKSKTATPSSSIKSPSAEDSQSTFYEQCECDVDGNVKEVKIAPPSEGHKPMGETDVDVIHPPHSGGDSDMDDPGVCAELPELRDVENQPLDLTEFEHEPIHCSPKCCSFTASEDAVEDGVVTMADDGEEEEGGEDEEEEEEEEKGPASKCSTCGGEPHDHQDCSFASSMATVCSWVDPEDPPLKALKESMKKGEGEDDEEEGEGEEEGEEEEGEQHQEIIAIPEKVIEASKTGVKHEHDHHLHPPQPGQAPEQASRKSAMPAKAKQSIRASGGDPVVAAPAPEQEAADPGVAVEYGEPVRMYSEIQSNIVGVVEPEAPSKKPTASPVSPDDEESEPETVSIPSMESSSNGSEEFMYIDPDEVIEALTEFCKEYNAKITVEEPSLDELIEKKLAKFKYPKHVYLTEYWERPLRMLSARSDDLWDTMEYCFQVFAESLKKRNEQVDEFVELYRRNYELSYLLRNHLSTATRKFSPAPTRSSAYQWSGQYC